MPVRVLDSDNKDKLIKYAETLGVSNPGNKSVRALIRDIHTNIIESMKFK